MPEADDDNDDAKWWVVGCGLWIVGGGWLVVAKWCSWVTVSQCHNPNQGVSVSASAKCQRRRVKMIPWKMWLGKVSFFHKNKYYIYSEIL